MEHGAGWGRPCEFQLATTNYWCADHPAPAQFWAAPAGDLPVDYASMGGMFFAGTCNSLQAYVPESSLGQHQMAEYNYNYNAAAAAAAATENDDKVEEYLENPIYLYEKKAQDFMRDIMMAKMHRYPSPPTIPDLGKWYKEPCVVAIGPYHHGLEHLKPAEEVKHVAAYSCIMESQGRSVQELYGAVISAVDRIYARDLYRNQDAGLSDNDFLPMMYNDACFLVQCMVWYTTDPSLIEDQMDRSLVKFFDQNYDGIRHDIMLLENQIPWGVVEAVLNLRKEPIHLGKFIALWKDSLQDRKAALEKLHPVVLDEHYKAPHLLGLLRFHIAGKSSNGTKPSDSGKVGSLSFSVSPVELAEMGIFLEAKGETTTELVQMGFKEKWWFFFFADLSLPPLTLTEARASRLLNMAALEVCTTGSDFFSAKEEDSAVCSYLRVLCMLVHREDDVHELRARGILQGAGLTDKETLDFLTKFHSLPHGPGYARVMDGIDRYRANKWLLIMLYRILYRNWKIISTIVPIIGTLVGISVKLISVIKGH